MQIIRINEEMDVIDPYANCSLDDLTNEQIIEQIETDKQLAHMERLSRERKYRAREMKKLKNSLAYKLCLLCKLPM